MESLAGQLLIASPSLMDPNFYRAVVLLVEHGQEGAAGVILNRPSTTGPGEELPEWTPLLAEPEVVFIGGPVEPQAAVGLAQTHGQEVLPGVGMVDLSATPGGDAAEVRVFAGYAGWGPGQLEAELDEGSWLILAALPADVFTPAPERLWRDVLRRQPGRVAMLAGFPDDPRLN